MRIAILLLCLIGASSRPETKFRRPESRVIFFDDDSTDGPSFPLKPMENDKGIHEENIRLESISDDSIGEVVKDTTFMKEEVAPDTNIDIDSLRIDVEDEDQNDYFEMFYGDLEDTLIQDIRKGSAVNFGGQIKVKSSREDSNSPVIFGEQIDSTAKIEDSFVNFDVTSPKSVIINKTDGESLNDDISSVNTTVSASVTTSIFDDGIFAGEFNGLAADLEKEKRQTDNDEVDENEDDIIDEDEEDEFVLKVLGEEAEEDDDDVLEFRIQQNSESKKAQETISMTLDELNDIFGKKKARRCLKRKKVYSLSKGNCYTPSRRGPCAENELFFGLSEDLRGACRLNPCQDPAFPILLNGTCVSQLSSCEPGMKLFYTRSGETKCGCEDGFLYNKNDERCYREFSNANCSRRGGTWTRRNKRRRQSRVDRTPLLYRRGTQGKCKRTKCQQGEVLWKDKSCYKVGKPEVAAICPVELVLDEENNEIVCMSEMGRGMRTLSLRKCRRGFFWSTFRRRCIRGAGR